MEEIRSTTRIAVVDQSELVRAVTRRALSSRGYTRIEEYSAGQSLIEAAFSSPPTDAFGLIILDWSLPPSGGLEVLYALKSRPRTRSIPIIIAVSDSERRYVIKALMAGANAYITKPCSADVLAEKIAGIGAYSLRPAA